MKNSLKNIQHGLLKAACLAVVVLVTASCQNDESLAADGASSEALLSIPSSVKISRMLINDNLRSSLLVNGVGVESNVRLSDSGFSISASLEETLLVQGTDTNNLSLDILYRCGQETGLGKSLLTLISLTKSFSYNEKGVDIVATSDSEPDSDLDGYSNHDECRDETSPIDADDPDPRPPTIGSALFAVGIAENRFYDTDTNDSQYLRLDGAIQELNDNFSQAKAIGANAETTGYVSSVSDEDDYYFVTGSGSGFVSLVSASSSANLDLYIYNNDGSLAFSSTNAGSVVESLNDLFLPFYIRVNGASGGGSLYKLVTAVGGQTSTRSTAVARFRLSLIDPETNTTLSEDGKFDTTFIVNGNLSNTQVTLNNIPAGSYNYRIHSDVNEDDGNFDSFYDMGVAATGSIVVTEGGQVSTTITLE